MSKCADFQDIILCILLHTALTWKVGIWQASGLFWWNVISMYLYLSMYILCVWSWKIVNLFFFFRYKVMKNWGVIGGIAAALAAGIYVIWGPITERKKRRKGKNEAIASWSVDLTWTIIIQKQYKKGRHFWFSCSFSFWTVLSFKQKLILMTHYFIPCCKKIHLP